MAAHIRARHVLRIEAVHFQKPCHLVSMVNFLVVLTLVGDVFHYSRNLRSADATGEVSFLPFESGWASLIDPTRRVGLEYLSAFGNTHCGGKREQRMNMVVHAADGQRVHAVICSDASHVGP